MNRVRRIAIFFVMFWVVGVVLTLAIRLFAGSVFSIDFHEVESGRPLALLDNQVRNVYIASSVREPDLATLKPQVTIRSIEEGGQLQVEDFSTFLRMESEPPVYARGIYSIRAKEAQEVEIVWDNPSEDFYLAISKSLRLPQISFIALILFALVGARILYILYGRKWAEKLERTRPL